MPSAPAARPYRFQRLPITGRFASPGRRERDVIPPVEARLSITRLRIGWAPVWDRGTSANPDGSPGIDIVPFYGVTRFSASAHFGQVGLTLLSGHDDIYGSIFHYLGQLRRGDVIRIWQGSHVYRYVVRSVSVVTPDDVRLLNAPRTRPTLALVSCTPYWVDTHRVVVIAEQQP
jgi:LPXTG-site transpeptidase (sortase) family protein